MDAINEQGGETVEALTEADRDRALEFTRHYDSLLWVVTSLLLPANAGLLAFAAGNPSWQIGVLGVGLSLTTVFFAASFRALRLRLHTRLRRAAKDDTWLYAGAAGWAGQWKIYVALFVAISLLWLSLLWEQFPRWRIGWAALLVVALFGFGWLYKATRRHIKLQERPATMAQQVNQKQATVPAERLRVYSVEELASAYGRQREHYDWDFSREREFMENLFCQRFNFLLVVYSIFATAAATTVTNQRFFVGVSFAGATLCAMVWLTIIRAYSKLMINLRILNRLDEHPVVMINKESDALGATRLFPVNPLIAYVAPAFCVLSLVAAAVAGMFGWLN